MLLTVHAMCAVTQPGGISSLLFSLLYDEEVKLSVNLSGNPGLTALPEGIGRLHNMQVLYLHHCPRLAALHDLQRQEGLLALLAHLAAQGEAAPAPGVEPS